MLEKFSRVQHQTSQKFLAVEFCGGEEKFAFEEVERLSSQS
jgi:hypothetical protein